ncbi:type IV toxin-antitoxin system AbiEi family antitoxin domain-containing protein [Microbacterium murale]|nr:type IV toxin-antitoxin system AbiEi family antitoxin domain-containing protein [Microbacterium murale]
MFDPASLISHLGGIARGVQLQQFGVTRHRLAAAVSSGEIQRLRPGTFASFDANAADLAAVRHGGALTCSAALRRHGVWVLSAEGPPHVWVGRRGRVHQHPGCACVSHFFRGIPPLSLAEVEHALLHLHRCEGAESFFASFESAWRLGLLSRPARNRIRAALPASDRWLVDFARHDADSGLESLLRLRLHLLGIAVECQVTIPTVGRVDFVVGGRLIIEADGKENHDGPSMRHKDLTRDAAASALGYETLHFDYAQVIYDWPTVQQAILGALTRLRDHA